MSRKPIGNGGRKEADVFSAVNVFCATGEGGGKDPSCGKGGKPASKASSKDPFPKRDLTIPYPENGPVPYEHSVSSKMKQHIAHMAQDLAEPRLLESASFVGLTNYNDGLIVPLGGHRRLGLITYDEPVSRHQPERFKKVIDDSGKDNWRAKAYLNYTIFTDNKGNASAAWGDKEEVKFLIKKFSSKEALRSLTEEDHRKLGKWFGYKPEAVNKWLAKTIRK